MSLHHDLLEQAEHLAAREKRRPKQASLRRAVSTAYYALFHLLIDEVSTLVMPDGRLPSSRSQVGRTFGHAEMKRVCNAFSAPPAKAKDELDRLVQATNAPPPDLIAVASAFVSLQEMRHQADYDTAKRYSRREVEASVRTARDAFDRWKRVRSHPVTKTFLVALVAWKKWDRL